MTDIDFSTEREGKQEGESISPESSEVPLTEEAFNVEEETPQREESEDVVESDEVADSEGIEREIYELTLRSDATDGSRINAKRYTELRLLGLTQREAFLAAGAQTAEDSRSHLGSAIPRTAARPKSGISSKELKEAREIFADASDAEILRLYRRVTGL